MKIGDLMKKQERITMKEKIRRHRSAHPHDKISFGEEPVTENNPLGKSSIKEDAISGWQETVPDKSASRKVNINRKRVCRCGKSDEMGRCKSCGKLVCKRCRIIGSCHTKKYSHGYHGQPYSGSKSGTNWRSWGGNGTN